MTKEFDRKKAEKIAEDFLKFANPSGWDGKGEKPDDVSMGVMEFGIGSKNGNILAVSLDCEDGVWRHYCEVVDAASNETILPMLGEGINSVEKIADTVQYVCMGEN